MSFLSKRSSAADSAPATFAGSGASAGENATRVTSPGTSTSLPDCSLTRARGAGVVRSANVWVSPRRGWMFEEVQRTVQRPSLRPICNCPV
ncbi:Uncharacterised protein [Mycobacteroides abscessus subsp. abscessus]|nr:Uncharacterised protein [Mycobacteroides abscessus subsp. abscessus]